MTAALILVLLTIFIAGSGAGFVAGAAVFGPNKKLKFSDVCCIAALIAAAVAMCFSVPILFI